MQAPTNFVPAEAPSDQRINRAISRTILSLPAVFALLLVIALVASSFYQRFTAETAYRQAAWSQVEAFNGIAAAMKEASSDDIYKVAAFKLPAAEASLKRLEELEPPSQKREFHRMLIKTYRAYTGALRLMADGHTNPLGTLFTSSLMSEKLDIYSEGIDRLDFTTLTVRD